MTNTLHHAGTTRVDFNFNDEVEVVLTPSGEKVWNAYWNDLMTAGPVWTAGKIRKMQLWEVAHIFGKAMFNGDDPPLETAATLIVRF
jgi:hypothetical protein